MLYCQYRYAALSVQGCCTISARLLHYQCKAAAPSVSGCCTIGIRVLYHRYQAAALFWYHYSSIFTLT